MRVDPITEIFFEVFVEKMRFLENEWRLARREDKSEYMFADLIYFDEETDNAIIFYFELRDNTVILYMQNRKTRRPDVFPPEAFPEAWRDISDPLLDLSLRLPFRKEYREFFNKSRLKFFNELQDRAIMQRDLEAARASLEIQAEFYVYLLRKYQQDILSIVKGKTR
ncbi:MAG: hypothetical protein KatS3mg022_2802 [Armatimonadota bacterium]|nr:MAG: hypothetical protein KatS3mg022_2802 [Armatimonadota bacterium]